MNVFVVTEEVVWDAYETSYEAVHGVFSSNEKAHAEIVRLSFGREIQYIEGEDKYLFSNGDDDYYYRIIMLELDR